MAGLSKLFDIGSVDFNCYEMGHTWSPSCTTAALIFGSTVVKEALKVNTAFYVANFVFRRQKLSKENAKKLVKSILQSTLFLGATGVVYIASTCLIRHYLGNFNAISASYLPGFISSLVGILLERQNRRSALFLYVSNLTSETIFRMLVFRNIIRPIPHGEVLLFCGSMALFMHNLKAHGCRDILATILRFLMNSSENHEKNDNHYSYQNGSVQDSVDGAPTWLVKWKESVTKYWTSKMARIRRLPRHKSCPHNNSCIYDCLIGYAKPFIFGTIVGTATSIPRMLRNPKSLWKEVLDVRKIQLGLFLSGFVGIYKTASCLLRWANKKDMNWHALPAGFLAGASMYFYKSSTISLYVIWKMVDIYYRIGMGRGVFPEMQSATIVLYALMCALLFQTAMVEPHNLKPAYYKFIRRMTGGLVDQINRKLGDAYGLHSSILYPDFCPDLDKRYMTPLGIETMKKIFPNF